MQRYFANVYQGMATLPEGDIFHIVSVMRMRPGEKFEVASSDGIYIAEITSTHPFTAKIVSHLDENHELPNAITLFYALAKGEKTDLVIQKATELGVSEIVGLISERTIVRLDDDDKVKKLSRYAKIIKEAGEQSHRGKLPKFDSIVDFKAIKNRHFDYMFIAYEGVAGGTGSFYETLKDIPAGKSIAIVIGAEGGFSPDEIHYANEAGYQSVALGKRILRSETAVFYALSAIGFLLER